MIDLKSNLGSIAALAAVGLGLMCWALWSQNDALATKNKALAASIEIAAKGAEASDAAQTAATAVRDRIDVVIRQDRLTPHVATSLECLDDPGLRAAFAFNDRLRVAQDSLGAAAVEPAGAVPDPEKH